MNWSKSKTRILNENEFKNSGFNGIMPGHALQSLTHELIDFHVLMHGHF